jgi:hypothetical protein
MMGTPRWTHYQNEVRCSPTRWSDLRSAQLFICTCRNRSNVADDNARVCLNVYVDLDRSWALPDSLGGVRVRYSRAAASSSASGIDLHCDYCSVAPQQSMGLRCWDHNCNILERLQPLRHSSDASWPGRAVVSTPNWPAEAARHVDGARWRHRALHSYRRLSRRHLPSRRRQQEMVEVHWRRRLGACLLCADRRRRATAINVKLKIFQRRCLSKDILGFLLRHDHQPSCT